LINIFVYGTLMHAELVKKLTQKNFSSRKAILKDFIRLKVKGQAYPAIIRKEEFEVKGILLLNVDKKSMEILDFYEGDEYALQGVSIYSNNINYEAYTYVWNDDINKLDSIDWSFILFQKNQAEYYLNTVIPETIKDFNAE